MSHFERGRLVTDWSWEEVTVFGGWRVRRVRWVRTANGWDEDQDQWAGPTIYKTADAAADEARRLNHL